MKPNKNQKIVFFIAIAALIALPLYFIMRSESMLADKENIYRFRPVRLCEPAEIMRGDYLTIDFQRNIEYKGSKKAGRGSECYIIVERDSAGYAYFDYATDKKPETSNYFTTKIVRDSWSDNVFVEIPFDRYFLSEDNSKLAEKVYELEVRNMETTNMYIEVAVNNGESLLKDIYVDSLPLQQFLNELTLNERKEIEEIYEEGSFRPRRRRLR